MNGNDRISPHVSIVMNCYNSAHYLRQAIESVISQSFKDWELIFWDNQSTDDSALICHGYADPRICYFWAPEHTSLGQARNLAIEQARGSLITFLDCDDRWLHTKLAQQVELFKVDAALDFVYGNCYVIDLKGKRQGLSYHKPQPQGDVFRSFLKHYPVNLQTVMLKKQSLSRLRILFDPALEVSEEYDLFMRLLYQGKAAYLNFPVAEYRVHQAMSSIRNIELYPLENEYILKKLSATISGFSSEYADELRYLMAKIAYWHAAAEMRKGSKSKARGRLAPYRTYGLMFFILYYLTFFPRCVWHYLQENRRKLAF